LCLLILTWLSAHYPDNPFLGDLSSGFFSGTKEIMNIIIGALIASLIGLFTSVALIDLEIERDRDNLYIGMN
jgi:hypothetical protein